MIKNTLLSQFSSLTISIIVMVLILAFFYTGVRVRKYLIAGKKSFDEKSFGAAEGSLLGLLALLLSFTFSMSSSRHDARIRIIVEEANNISTAVLRADLYPDSIRNAFRQDFKAYIESRIEYFEAGIDTGRIIRSLQTSAAIQQSLWKRATNLGQDKENFHRSSLMIPALNDMFDIVTTRYTASIAKVPELIVYLLFLLCFTSAFMLGYSVGKKPDWIIMIGFSAMIATTIYLIIDLDKPRNGIITMKDVNTQIVQLRSMFIPGE